MIEAGKKYRFVSMDPFAIRDKLSGKTCTADRQHGMVWRVSFDDGKWSDVDPGELKEIEESEEKAR